MNPLIRTPWNEPPKMNWTPWNHPSNQDPLKRGHLNKRDNLGPQMLQDTTSLVSVQINITWLLDHITWLLDYVTWPYSPPCVRIRTALTDVASCWTLISLALWTFRRSVYRRLSRSCRGAAYQEGTDRNPSNQDTLGHKTVSWLARCPSILWVRKAVL